MRHFLVPELICYKPRQNNFTFKNSASFIRLVDNVSVCKVQSWGSKYCFTTRVILGQVLTIVTCMS